MGGMSIALFHDLPRGLCRDFRDGASCAGRKPKQRCRGRGRRESRVRQRLQARWRLHAPSAQNRMNPSALGHSHSQSEWPLPSLPRVHSQSVWSFLSLPRVHSQSVWSLPSLPRVHSQSVWSFPSLPRDHSQSVWSLPSLPRAHSQSVWTFPSLLRAHLQSVWTFPSLPSAHSQSGRRQTWLSFDAEGDVLPGRSRWGLMRPAFINLSPPLPPAPAGAPDFPPHATAQLG